MRLRLLAIVSALLVAIVAFPFVATAQTTNIARISSTTYYDMTGSGVNLCSEEAIIEAIVSYSGIGAELGGNGTGELEIYASSDFFEFGGYLEVGGETVYVEGGGSLFCVLPGMAIVSGEFIMYGDEPIESAPTALQIEEGEVVCGSLTGSIQDGAHPRQGRVSLTLTGSTECIFA